MALRGVRVVGRAVAEDPAVHEQTGEDPQLHRLRVVVLAARAPEVLDELVVAGVDPQPLWQIDQ